MYGTQTINHLEKTGEVFENDVKMYGTQTIRGIGAPTDSLRMM